MKGLFKHFFLIAMLIIHTSWGSVLAAQMLSASLSMNPDESSLLSEISKTSTNKEPNNNDSPVSVSVKISSIDNTTERPCPHHSNMQINDTSMESSSLHCNDCSNCNCVNVLTSIPMFTPTIESQAKPIHTATDLVSVLPDSPPSFILRPPKS